MEMAIPFNTEYERLHHKVKKPSGTNGAGRVFLHDGYT
jgi:hypothetical protein